MSNNSNNSNNSSTNQSLICTCGNLPDYSTQIELQKATQTINQANQKLAKIPEETISNIKKSIEKLMKIINGWEDDSSEDFDPDKVIDDIKALLDPVVNSLCKIVKDCGLPEIPGLSDIAELLTKLLSMKKSPYQKPGKLPEIPPQLMQTLEDLLAAIQALCTTLPMVCVNILFNTVDLILSTGIPVVGLNFYTIIGMVPFVKQIPDLVTLAPKISDLVVNAPGKINKAVKGKLKQQLKAINDMQVPEAPTSIAVNAPSKCPIHG